MVLTPFTTSGSTIAGFFIRAVISFLRYVGPGWAVRGMTEAEEEKVTW